ncbi:MAG: SDR family oxidoreductase [Euryarchaeota archaeon]|nr:SDR family oxidoreductase [Euryarchaeota archaeon]
MTKTALVTGGAGFIGSHLCDRLLEEGYRVIAVDNLLTGSPRNLAHLRGNPRFRFLRRDINRPLRVPGRVDLVLHFASPASPKDFEVYPIQILKAGALGTHHMLGLARAHRSTFLLASTSEVYGDPRVDPQPESYWGNVNPVGIRGVYDEAKRFAEAMTMAYHRVHGLDTKIARIFNTYGPRMRPEDGRAIPNFITQALRARPLTVHGRGRQTRSFCYINDLIEGILRLTRSPTHGPINLGNPENYTILQLARRIQALTGSPSRIVYRPLPQDDPRQRRPDIRLARRLLHWSPRTGLDEGLKETIAYFHTVL